MPAHPNILDQVRQFIKKDELALAIDLLSQLLKNSPALDKLILHSARHSRISAQIRQGIVDFEQANITQNQISDALIDMVRDMEESVANNPITEQELKQFNENFTPTIHINNSKNVVTGNISAGGNVVIGDKNITQHHTGSGDNVGRDKIEKQKVYNIHQTQTKQKFNDVLTALKQEFAQISITEETNGISSRYSGKEMLLRLIKHANRPLDIAGWNQYKALMNVYGTTKQLLLLVKSEQSLSETSKKLVLMEIELFYDNNLRLEKDDRGDAFCEKCNTMHQIPNEWRVLINDLENEMKN